MLSRYQFIILCGRSHIENAESFDIWNQHYTYQHYTYQHYTYQHMEPTLYETILSC